MPQTPPHSAGLLTVWITLLPVMVTDSAEHSSCYYLQNGVVLGITPDLTSGRMHSQRLLEAGLCHYQLGKV
jgi:hypothetical protein